MAGQKIKTFLWFDQNAEEATNLYVSIFPNSSIGRVTPGPTGAPMVIEFTLAGVEYVALNGGPMYQFTEAISLSVGCSTQEEIDELWDKLSAGGSPGRCGWLKDKFGLSWQIVPESIGQLIGGSDREKAGRAMAALMQMTRIDLATLQNA